MIENNNWVEEILKDRNMALTGFADLTEIDENLRYGFKYGISIAIALKIIPSITNEPSKKYYDEYEKVSQELKEVKYGMLQKEPVEYVLRSVRIQGNI